MCFAWTMNVQQRQESCNVLKEEENTEQHAIENETRISLYQATEIVQDKKKWINKDNKNLNEIDLITAKFTTKIRNEFHFITNISHQVFIVTALL